MAQYIFGILILVLLFREVLGYKELEKGIFIAAGIVIAVAGGVVEACFDVFADFNIWIYRFFLILPSLILMFIFKGRKGVIFGAGFCILCLMRKFAEVTFGIKLISNNEKALEFNDYII